MNTKRIKRRKLLISTFIFMIGLALLGYGTYLFYVDNELLKVSVEINATIKELNYDTTPNKLTIYYDVKGTRYENVIEYDDENGNTVIIESESLEYLHEQKPEPTKKKCGKKSALMLNLLSAAPLLVVCLKKKK